MFQDTNPPDPGGFRRGTRGLQAAVGVGWVSFPLLTSRPACFVFYMNLFEYDTHESGENGQKDSTPPVAPCAFSCTHVSFSKPTRAIGSDRLSASS